MEKKSRELEVAIKAAREAGKILEKYFETEILKNLKEDKSIVTLADGECEEVIKKIILENFPDHSILGEETGLTGQGEYVWHVDPVDGTRNFANGIPIFATSVALVYRDEVTVSVVYNPATRSMFYAEKGNGTYLNDKRIFVSKDDPDHAIVSVAPGKKEWDRQMLLDLYYELPKSVRSIRNLGCSAVELAYVARGGLEAHIELGLNTYDFAAGVLLVQEAGGKITNLEGKPWKFPENYFIVSNGIFHDLLVEEVQKLKKKMI
jgi:myo-inositol-1(or 4)-monophosphatase